MAKNLSVYYRACILFIFMFLLASNNLFSGWTHLELGAGNYGNDGLTKQSMRKTVLKKVKILSDKPTFIDSLEESSSKPIKPEEQFRNLFDTLDQLISRYGPTGVFHINDLYLEYAKAAQNALRVYASKKGYTHVIIETISGNWENIQPELYLTRFGRLKYDSVHLKNPEVSFYNWAIDGDSMISSVESRQKARTTLQKLANYSKEGLYFFVIWDDPDYLPIEEKSEFFDQGIFYTTQTSWLPVPYISPEGICLNRADEGRVFFIKAE